MYNRNSIIKKFKSIHGEKYDYSKVDFVKTTEKVCIICPIHGEFFQEPHAHIKGQGCPICGKEKKRISKTYTTDEFIKKSKDIYGELYDYSKVEYLNSKKKVEIICRIHGGFLIEPNSHLQGKGCPKCGNMKKGKNPNNKLYDFINKICGSENVIFEDNIIHVPNKKISFTIIDLHKGSEIKIKNTSHFLDNTEKFEKRGEQLIQIYKDEWDNKNEICKSRIKNFLGFSKKIYARKCKVIKVDKYLSKKFLTENHIQGNVPSLIVYGLEYNNEIVSLMSFGGLRKNMGQKHNNESYELLRFCNKLGFSVIGGASKLFSYFIKNNNPNKIISYADRRWSNGKLYDKIGFSHSHNSKPSYFYVIKNERKNRFAYRKDVLIKKYGCEPNDTEHNFCFKQGWYRIYDCGTKVYKWINTNNLSNI